MIEQRFRLPQSLQETKYSKYCDKIFSKYI